MLFMTFDKLNTKKIVIKYNNNNTIKRMKYFELKMKSLEN